MPQLRGLGKSISKYGLAEAMPSWLSDRQAILAEIVRIFKIALAPVNNTQKL